MSSQLKNLLLLIIAINQINNNVVYSQSKYSHSVNDCYHLCFGFEPCIEKCLHGFSNRLHNYNALGGGPLTTISNLNKGVKAYQKEGGYGSGSPFDSPTHCGLKTRTQSRKRVYALGRIVGGMDTIVF